MQHTRRWCKKSKKTFLESFNDCQLNRVHQGTGEGHKKNGPQQKSSSHKRRPQHKNSLLPERTSRQKTLTKKETTNE